MMNIIRRYRAPIVVLAALVVVSAALLLTGLATWGAEIGR